jgi:hypothetical protein
MRTSFHHQPEAQHPNSSAIHKLAGRLPHLSEAQRTSAQGVIQDVQFGLLLRQSVEDDARKLDTWRHWTRRVREKDWPAWSKRLLIDAWHGRHRVWLRFIAALMSVLFFGAAGWIWVRPQ